MSNKIFKGQQLKVEEYDFLAHLKDYFDLSVFRKLLKSGEKKHSDRVYSRNKDVYEDILNGNIRPGQNIILKEFNVLEWIPASPGLFFTSSAKAKRKAAISKTSFNEKKFVHSFFPQIDPKVIELTPDGKRGMIQGGYGSVRLSPKIIENKLQAIVGISSTGVSHDGLVATVNQEDYDEIADRLNSNLTPIVNVVGRLRTFPKGISPIELKYESGVPKYYFEVTELNFIGEEDIKKTLVTIAISYSSEERFLQRKEIGYSFCSFNPSKDNSNLRQGVNWLKDYAKRYSQGDSPIIVGDFDEIYSHFDDVIFPIKHLANGKVSYEALDLLKSSYIGQFNIHYKINKVHMGDENTFNNSQIGAVGSNAQSNNNQFQQNNAIVPNNLDYDKLHQQLIILRENLQPKAKTPEDFKALGEIAEAEVASEKKDGNKVVKHLKSAGEWVLDNAKDIGVDIVTELIKKQMEL